MRAEGTVREIARLCKGKWLLKDPEVWGEVARSGGTWRSELCSAWVGTGDVHHEQNKLWSLHAVTGTDEETSGDLGEGAPFITMKGQSQGAVLRNPVLTFL